MDLKLQNETDEIDPFRRRESIRRSPPRERSFSLGMSPARDADEVFYVGEEIKLPEATTEIGTVKRQREDSEDELKELRKMFTKLKKVIKDLTQEVQQNTRVEIKKGIKVAKGQVDEIARQWDGLTQSVKERKKSKMMEEESEKAQARVKKIGGLRDGGGPTNLNLEERLLALEKANEELKADNEALRKEIRDLAKSGVKGKMRNELFVNGGDYTQFIEVEDLEWPKDIYKSAIRAAGSPLRTSKDVDLLLLQEEGCLENDNTKGDYLERYPELSDLQGKLTAILVTTKIINEDGATEGHDRWVYKMEVNNDRKDFFESLIKLKILMLKNGRRKVAIYPPGWDTSAKVIIKMAEWAFRDSGIECHVHTNKQEGEPTRSNKNRGDALILRQEGKNYAEILRTFREKIKPESTGARAIRTIREARDGSMVVVLDKDSQHCADHLREEIKSTGCIKIVKDINYRKMTLFVNEIDGVTTREEVKDVLCTETGLAEDQVQVSELRISYGGNRTAAVVIPKEEGEKLLSRGVMRIGLSLCPVKERVDVSRCFRCWQYGHIARNCTESMDSSKLCRRCGQEGHLAKNCNGEEKCLTCQQPGHTAGSGRCPEFRKAVARERLNRKNKKRY